jgi:hypothetical protein
MQLLVSENQYGCFSIGGQLVAGRFWIGIREVINGKDLFPLWEASALFQIIDVAVRSFFFPHHLPQNILGGSGPLLCMAGMSPMFHSFHLYIYAIFCIFLPFTLYIKHLKNTISN